MILSTISWEAIPNSTRWNPPRQKGRCVGHVRLTYRVLILQQLRINNISQTTPCSLIFVNEALCVVSAILAGSSYINTLLSP
jgi:hypothetical protein